MIIPQDQLFRDEAERYQLRWNCEDCVRFVEESTEGGLPKGSCAHGFPTEKHRRLRYQDPDAGLLFCKEFQLI